MQIEISGEFSELQQEIFDKFCLHQGYSSGDKSVFWSEKIWSFMKACAKDYEQKRASEEARNKFDEVEI